MKPKLFFSVYAIFLFSCNQQTGNSRELALSNKIDSLQKAIDNAYKPGLGEFMNGIQLHHEKLWFAGKNENWKLADFEVNEMKEVLTDIRTYCRDRPEIRLLNMIDPALDSLNQSIQDKNNLSFKNNFVILTHTCNSCHQATKHEFNLVRVPGASDFSDQDFKPQ